VTALNALIAANALTASNGLTTANGLITNLQTNYNQLSGYLQTNATVLQTLASQITANFNTLFALLKGSTLNITGNATQTLSLQVQLNVLNATLSFLQTNLFPFGIVNFVTPAQLNAVSSAVTLLQGSTTTTNAAIAILQANVTSLNTQIANLQTLINGYNVSLSNQINVLSALEQTDVLSINTINQLIMYLQNNNTATAALLNATIVSLAATQSTVAGLLTNQTLTASILAQLQANFTFLATQPALLALQSRIAALEATVNTGSTANAALLTAIGTLQTTINSNTTGNAALLTAIGALQKTVNSNTTGDAFLAGQVSTLTSNVTTLFNVRSASSNVVTLQTNVLTLFNTTASLQTQLISSGKVGTALQTQLNTIDSSITTKAIFDAWQTYIQAAVIATWEANDSGYTFPAGAGCDGSHSCLYPGTATDGSGNFWFWFDNNTPTPYTGQMASVTFGIPYLAVPTVVFSAPVFSGGDGNGFATDFYAIASTTGFTVNVDSLNVVGDPSCTIMGCDQVQFSYTVTPAYT
jgi:chromosome segregation ATPase